MYSIYVYPCQSDCVAEVGSHQDDFYSALSKIKGIVAKPILTEEELDLLDSKAGAQTNANDLVLQAIWHSYMALVS